MRTTISLVLLVLIFSIRGFGQTTEIHSGGPNASALDHEVPHFDVTDSTL